MRSPVPTLSAALLLALTACYGAGPKREPDVRLDRLAAAAEVLSAGPAAGDRMRIRYGGRTWRDLVGPSTGSDGLWLFAVSGSRVLADDHFNTAASSSADDRLLETVRSFPEDTLVIVAAKGEAGSKVGKGARSALRRIGARSLLNDLPDGTSYLCLGRIGARAGSAIERAGKGPQRWAGLRADEPLALELDSGPAPAPIPEGLSSRRFERVGLNLGRPIDLWLYRPEGWLPGSPILFVMHGHGRDAESYLKDCRRMAGRRGALLVAPQFSKADYPDSRWYNHGGVEVEVRGRRAVDLIEVLFDYAVACTGSTRSRYDILGHSAGGQLVHRFVMVRPDARFDTAVACNAGSYLMPDFSAPLPYGLAGQGDVTRQSLAASLGRNLVVLVGERDVRPLEEDDARAEQGPNRVARAKTFFDAVEAMGRELGVPMAWRLRYARGASHDRDELFEAAEEFLYPGG